MDEFTKQRIAKKAEWKKRQPAYYAKFEKKDTCKDASEKEDKSPVQSAGRLMLKRDMGKLSFCKLQDNSGQIQIALKTDTIGADEYKFLTKNLDIGDHIGISGEIFTTKRGEKTIEVKKCILLSKAIAPLPEKWHGLRDKEQCARKRYLDLLCNEESREKFKKRSKLISLIREHLNSNDFMEVETPILQQIASGAAARPFITKHNAMDINLYMRIAPETYLKRLMVGGYEKVYEIGKCFRNEGIDPSHLQEFTMLEWYCAYWDYRDNMKFAQDMIQTVVKKLAGKLEFEFEGGKIDLGGNWQEIDYKELIKKHTKIDINKVSNVMELKEEIKKQNIEMDFKKYISMPSIVDNLYKKHCRPKIKNPTFITGYPPYIVPLARVSDDNKDQLDMFQLVIEGLEIIKSYSELIDPIEQREKLTEQSKLKEEGEEEYVALEEDFIEAMEYGMPPMSGLGIGIDRLICLITNSSNIRDIIYFPSLKSDKP